MKNSNAFTKTFFDFMKENGIANELSPKQHLKIPSYYQIIDEFLK